jgi:hypothetical protein
VAPKAVLDYRESDLRGSQTSGSDGEEQPPKIVERNLDFNGSQKSQREHHSFRGSLLSGVGGREEYSKLFKKVSWIEEGRLEARKQEA